MEFLSLHSQLKLPCSIRYGRRREKKRGKGEEGRKKTRNKEILEAFCHFLLVLAALNHIMDFKKKRGSWEKHFSHLLNLWFRGKCKERKKEKGRRGKKNAWGAVSDNIKSSIIFLGTYFSKSSSVSSGDEANWILIFWFIPKKLRKKKGKGER